MKALEYGALIRGITSRMNEYIGQISEQYGISAGQFEYFMLIYQSPGVNQLELARLKNVGKASVTKALAVLENDGFITRTPDEKDKRNMLCSVTEKGKATAGKLLHLSGNIQSALFAGFSEEDMSRFYRYLSRLSQNAHSLAQPEVYQEDDHGPAI